MSSIVSIKIGQVTFRFAPMRENQAGLASKVVIVGGVVYALRKQTGTQVDIYSSDLRRIYRRKRQQKTPAQVVGADAIRALGAFGVIGATALQAELHEANFREYKQQRIYHLEWCAKEMGIEPDANHIEAEATKYATERMKL